MKEKLKRYLIDLVGIILIIASLLLGWLPGPGGIPLLLAGLGLLAINNKWAESILIRLRDKGEDLIKILFPNNKPVQATHDVLAIILFSTGIFLLITQPNKILTLAGFPIAVLGITEFLFNRDRLDKFKKKH